MNGRKLNPTLLKTWDAALEQTCAQNAPIELVPTTADGKALPLVRARLLGVGKQDGVLVVEKPSNLQQAQVLKKGVNVEVVLISSSSRMKASSVVIDEGLFKLNAKTKVPAIRLSAVTDISSAQRRSCFRLSTTGIHLPPVRMTHPDWPKDQSPIEATLVDVSDRGMGVTVRMDLELAEKMKGQEYDVRVELPGEDDRLELRSRVVRVIETAYRTITLGIQFEFTTQAQQRRVERTIQQFSVAQQRKQIRRLRGAG